jgi:hypothetical protein
MAAFRKKHQETMPILFRSPVSEKSIALKKHAQFELFGCLMAGS